VTIKILTDAKISEHDGYDLCNIDNKAFPLTDLDTFKMKKDQTLGDFKVRE
jgi:hypothetical protein